MPRQKGGVAHVRWQARGTQGGGAARVMKVISTPRKQQQIFQNEERSDACRENEIS